MEIIVSTYHCVLFHRHCFESHTHANLYKVSSTHTHFDTITHTTQCFNSHTHSLTFIWLRFTSLAHIHHLICMVTLFFRGMNIVPLDSFAWYWDDAASDRVKYLLRFTMNLVSIIYSARFAVSWLLNCVSVRSFARPSDIFTLLSKL